MNKVFMLGRLTADPELRYTATTQTPVANFRLAVDRRFKRDGEPDADFFNCLAWSKAAETINKYCAKGSQICIVGRIQNGSYKNQQGVTVYTTTIVVEEFSFAGNKQHDQQPDQGTTPAGSDKPEDGFMHLPPSTIDEELPFN